MFETILAIAFATIMGACLIYSLVKLVVLSIDAIKKNKDE